MSPLSSIVRSVLFAVLLTTSIGCGTEGSPTAPSPSDASNAVPNPPAPIPTGSTVVPAANGGVPGLYRTDAVISRSGTATMTLTWPDADFSLQLFVTSGTCLDLTALLAGTCITVGNTRPGDRPGVVSSPVTTSDLRTIWVLNPDFAPQPFTVVTAIE